MANETKSLARRELLMIVKKFQCWFHYVDCGGILRRPNTTVNVGEGGY